MLYLGGDHAGFKLKEQLKKYFDTSGVLYKDCGPLEFIPTDDYPDYGFKVAKKVSEDKKNRGIVICGSSAGVCIVANKVKGIRAASVADPKLIKLIRAHDDINILCLSGWSTSIAHARKIAQIFLKTPFSGEERHIRRIDKITRIEETY